MRSLLGILLSVVAGVLTMLAIARLRGEALFPDAIVQGLMIAVPVALIVAALGRMRRNGG
jgi:hypothetical protein